MYSVKFNIFNGSIIIDDVHACMDKIISQFMIKIDAESDAYKELIAIFSSSLKDYNPKNYIDIVEMKDCRKKMLVPYWEWQRQQDNIYKRNMIIVRILQYILGCR